MTLDLSNEAIDRRIDSLRTGYAVRALRLRQRNETYLRLFSPAFDPILLEHDQWPEGLKAQDAGKSRNSFNLSRAVVELWTALEASPFPSIDFTEDYIPSPIPDLDPQVNEQREQTHRSAKLVARAIATMREQALLKHITRGRLARHYYRAALRKNLYGLAWLSCIPDVDRERFNFKAGYDPSTVYPVWAAWDDKDLAAILVVTRKNARSIWEQYPDLVEFENDGDNVSTTSWYLPTDWKAVGEDRSWVWCEDYWVLDRTFSQDVADDEPVKSRVVHAMRVNGKIADKIEYPGWKTIPFVAFENDNLRDRQGFSDVGTVGPINDSINRMVSQQSDVIAGESKPKFKHRSDTHREVVLADDGVIHLDTDEDIEQLQIHMDVFPTQVHGTMLMELLNKVTGLNDSVWGRIVASQNSGRALATAWRSVAARLIPRLVDDGDALDRLVTFMLDTMELYDWDSAKRLYRGSRDFVPGFPNQEPRDFMEVATVAINKKNASLIDTPAAMEETGEKSPDAMLDRIRAEFMDAVMHPDKSQSFLLLKQLKQRLEIEAVMAQIQLQQALATASQPPPGTNTPPGGAPGGANGGPNPAAATQARTQAAQQAAPNVRPGQGPQPATQAGQSANGTQNVVSTLVQDGGPARNRIVSKTPY